MSELRSKYNWISVVIFVVIIIIAHFFVPSSYDWKNNTISELASQNYSNKWIMKIGFILFGGVLSIGIASKSMYTKKLLIKEFLILIYGLSILVSGVFSTKPFVEGLDYSELESQIHSYCASIAGVSFSISLLIFGFSESKMNLKFTHYGFFIFVIGCSALFGLLDSNVGIVQRIMYLGSFIWLLFYYNIDYPVANEIKS